MPHHQILMDVISLWYKEVLNYDTRRRLTVAQRCAFLAPVML